MAETGEAPLPALANAVIVAAFAMLYVMAGALIRLVVAVERHRASLRQRGLPVPPRLSQSPTDWLWALLLVLMAVCFVAMTLTNPAHALWLQLAMAAPFVAFLGGSSWLLLSGRGESELPETMAYFDFFGRVSPRALSQARGPLALAARVLHRNIDPLKGEFTVVTTGGDDRDRFPKGRERLFPRWVALVSNRDPFGLFFRRGALFPIDRALYVEELRYELEYGSDAWKKRWVFPKTTARGLLPGGRRIRSRLGVGRVTEGELQWLVDAFVRKASAPGARRRISRPDSARTSR